MRSAKVLLPLLFSVIFWLSRTSAQPPTYPNLIPNVWSLTAQQAAQRLVSGNVQVFNANFGDDWRQLGGFNEGLDALGFDEGIVLTTGEVSFAGTNGNSNPGDQQAISPHIAGSDSDLNALNGPGSVYNKAVLEFDFVSSANSISFKFVFGSEEYLEYVNSNYNDAFGFFLSGPGISGPYSNNAVNLAMVGGQAVSVNTVNPWSNATFYHDNHFSNPSFDPVVEGVNAQLQYDGYTYGLVATANIVCNMTYHLKIGICNTSDGALDSGVFIEKGGITSSYYPPGPLTISPSPVCAGEEITLTVGGPADGTYTWSTGQSGVGLQTVTTIATLGQDSYSVDLEYLPGCTLSGASPSASLVVHDPVNVAPQCLGVNGTGGSSITMQVGEQTCFTIPTSDTPNERVQIQVNGSLLGGSFDDNSAFQETGIFCWTPSITDLGFHTVEVRVFDNNTCEILESTCTFTIKVVCAFCPVDVYYENRAPGYYPLPALTVAGASITAGYSVDPGQTDGNVITGNASVEFRAPFIDLQPGFTAGPGFLAIVDANTCIQTCDDCCDNWGGFTVDTYENGPLFNVFTPNGDGVNDLWEVVDIDHPYCAYGAMAYDLEIYNQYGTIYRKAEPWSETCCPFQSWSPSNNVISSINWDGTVNVGVQFCQGCYVSSSVYNYIVTLYGCSGEVSYTGNVQVLGSSGMAMEPVADALQYPRGAEVAIPTDSITSGNEQAITTSVDSFSKSETTLYMQPNPASEQLLLNYALGIERVWLLDAAGRKVLEIAPQGQPIVNLYIQNLAPASYVVVVLTRDDQVHKRKLIKQ